MDRENYTNINEINLYLLTFFVIHYLIFNEIYLSLSLSFILHLVSLRSIFSTRNLQNNLIKGGDHERVIQEEEGEGEEERNEDDRNGEFRCKECNHISGSKKQLENHARKHRKIMCEECGVTMLTKSMKRHKETCKEQMERRKRSQPAAERGPEEQDVRPLQGAVPADQHDGHVAPTQQPQQQPQQQQQQQQYQGASNSSLPGIRPLGDAHQAQAITLTTPTRRSLPEMDQEHSPTPPREPERGAARQQQQHMSTPGDLSEEGWLQIDDLANVFMRNIYSQKIRVNSSLHRLKKLKSGSAEEKGAFKNILNKIFLDLTLIETFDREKIIILAQLLSGIINLNFTNETQTSMGLNYVIQALESNASSIEFTFGRTSLDGLKPSLNQFPHHCQVILLIPYIRRYLDENLILSMEAAVRSDATSSTSTSNTNHALQQQAVTGAHKTARKSRGTSQGD